MEPSQSLQPSATAFADPTIPLVPVGPLSGRWHHGQGYIVCGTIRIARLAFDTAPATAFQDELLDWLCERLNADTSAALAAAQAAAHTAVLIEGLKLAVEQIQDFEPVPGDVLSSDEEDTQQHRAWLRRRAVRLDRVTNLIKGPSEGARILAEVEELRRDLAKQIAGAAEMITAFEIGRPQVEMSERSPGPEDADDEGQVYCWIPASASPHGLPAVPGGWELRGLHELAGASIWCRTGLKRPPTPKEAA